MKFPRQAKIFRGQLDVAPFAGVFFLLAIFLLLHSSLVLPTGVQLQLPDSGDWPGADAATLSKRMAPRGAASGMPCCRTGWLANKSLIRA